MTGASAVRLPGPDLLRAVAIVWVMLYHLESYGVAMPAIVRHGWMGVDLFFVLSGYLIGAQLLRPCARGGQPRWGEFMLRRAFRILPAYWTVLAVYFLLPALGESDGIAPLWQFLTFTTNIFPDYAHQRAFSHAWSLCVEEHFYLMLPPVVWLLMRMQSRHRVAAAAATIVIGGAVLRGWLWHRELAPLAGADGGDFIVRWVETIYNPTWTRLDGLVAGVLLAAVEVFRPRWWSRAMEYWPWPLLAGVAGVAACMSIEPTSHIAAVVLFPLLALSFAALLVASSAPGAWLVRYCGPVVRYTALISFSLYLTHKQVFAAVHRHLRPDGSGVWASFAYVACAFVAAGLLYLLVERSGLRLRDRVLAGRGGAANPSLAVPVTGTASQPGQ